MTHYFGGLKLPERIIFWLRVSGKGGSFTTTDVRLAFSHFHHRYIMRMLAKLRDENLIEKVARNYWRIVPNNPDALPGYVPQTEQTGEFMTTTTTTKTTIPHVSHTSDPAKKLEIAKHAIAQAAAGHYRFESETQSSVEPGRERITFDRVETDPAVVAAPHPFGPAEEK